MDAAEEACRYYQKRFRIETFFSDQKSRGFHIHQSHISDPQRLSRLLIAACLAYIWIIYLGSLGEKEGWRSIIHRHDRCDRSLFQLGVRILEHFRNEDLPIPVVFHINI
jgi:Transposase DDE domain